MRLDLGGTPYSKRSLARAAIAALGLAALIGSGGGSAPECSFFSNSCNIGPIVFPPIPYASIEPERVTVQVGATAVFNARSGSVVQPSYRWCRTPAGATVCTEIAGATGASYTLVGANLADDGTQLKVTVSDPNGTAFAVSQLAVSSLPGVVIRDGDFAAADWTASATLVPPLNGPSFVGSSPATGGHPGAFASMSYQVRPEPGSVTVLHTALAATYDPATQGAIHVIDFDEDCLLQSQATSNVIPYTQPMFEQGGRVYVAAAAWRRGCAAAAWLAAPRRASLGRQDFVLLSGLACGAGAACPDFSASAARLRFGFVSGVDLPAGAAAGTVTQGVDNWQVTVWRR